MIYAKETPKNARAILGNDVYDSISAKTGIEGGLGHKLYEQWRALPDGNPSRLPIEAQSKAYYDAIRSKAGISSANSLRKIEDGLPLTGINSLDTKAIYSSSFTQKIEAMKRSGFDVIEDSKFLEARGQFDGKNFTYNPETMTRLDFAHEWRHFNQLTQMGGRGISLTSKNMRMANSPAEYGAYKYEQKLWQRMNVTPTDTYMQFHSSRLDYYEQGLSSFRAQLTKPYNAAWRGINW